MRTKGEASRRLSRIGRIAVPAKIKNIAKAKKFLERVTSKEYIQ
jgi:hypothetical protein